MVELWKNKRGSRSTTSRSLHLLTRTKWSLLSGATHRKASMGCVMIGGPCTHKLAHNDTRREQYCFFFLAFSFQAVCALVARGKCADHRERDRAMQSAREDMMHKKKAWTSQVGARGRKGGREGSGKPGPWPSPCAHRQRCT